MLPENHRDIVEAILVSASRFRGMANSELKQVPGIDKILVETMPYLYQENCSPIIEACGRYLDHPYGQGFYNIVNITKREPTLVLMLDLYQNMTLPDPDISWVLDM